MGRKKRRSKLSRRGKRPVAEEDPSLGKAPGVGTPAWKPERRPAIGAAPLDHGREQPSWRVAHLETVDPFGWHTLGRSKALEVHRKLRDFESMTWNEILVRDKRRHHQVDRDRLSRVAQARLQELELDDVDQLLSLRLSGRERVWGILQDGVALLLWWDPDHQVCPAKLRHT